MEDNKVVQTFARFTEQFVSELLASANDYIFINDIVIDSRADQAISLIMNSDLLKTIYCRDNPPRSVVTPEIKVFYLLFFWLYIYYIYTLLNKLCSNLHNFCKRF
jgi:hypothetical protein